MTEIVLRKVSKAFGPDPLAALKLAAKGTPKDKVRAETGANVALLGVSLKVGVGETLAVMGLSGSGKSTLVRLVNRLIEPTAGTVSVGGKPVGQMSEADLMQLRRRTVSMVFQNFALFPHLDVRHNVAFGLSVRGEAKIAARQIADKWIARVGLKGYEHARPEELSGGMRQRVGLARALATNPRVLLMDEPFSALDPLIRKKLQDQLLGLQAKLRKTMLFITHDLDEAARMGDRIAILRDGRLVQIGTPEDIYRAPADDYVRAFVKAAPAKAPDLPWRRTEA